MYNRVIPRDLFNEAKLLKCMGQMSLLIHDGVDKHGAATPPGLTIRHDEDDNRGFDIGQDPSNGELTVYNLRVEFNGKEVFLSTRYNSKEPFPLTYGVDQDGDVFTLLGTFTDEFLEYLQCL